MTQFVWILIISVAVVAGTENSEVGNLVFGGAWMLSFLLSLSSFQARKSESRFTQTINACIMVMFWAVAGLNAQIERGSSLIQSLAVLQLIIGGVYAVQLLPLSSLLKKIKTK
jgi:Na+/glutamate symporter